MNTLFRMEISDRSGQHEYEVRLLHEFGRGDGYLDATKISNLWAMASRHSTLFSDYTEGKAEPFLAVLINPRSVWFEIFRVGEQEGPVGVAYVSDVIPRFDAKGHFAFWDSIAGGREPLIWSVMDWLFDRYGLRRISTEVPPYQAGTIRFVKNLGFKQEGERREAVLHKGKWFPLIEFGMLEREHKEIFLDYLAGLGETEEQLEAVGG